MALSHRLLAEVVAILEAFIPAYEIGGRPPMNGRQSCLDAIVDTSDDEALSLDYRNLFSAKTQRSGSIRIYDMPTVGARSRIAGSVRFANQTVVTKKRRRA